MPSLAACRALAALLFIAGFTLPRLSAAAEIIHRDGWSFDRSDLIVYPGTDLGKKRGQHSLQGIGGWVEYDIQVPKAGWYELWLKGVPPDYPRDTYLDGKVMLWLATSEPGDVADGGWIKECNLHLAAGRHTLRLKRLMYGPVLPSQWELRPSAGNPAGSVRVVDPGYERARFSPNAVRVGDLVKLTLEGGLPSAATAYTLVARDGAGALTDLATVEFPASDRPVRREVSFSFPHQEVFLVMGREGGHLLRPADVKAGEYAVVDTRLPDVADTGLRVRNVVDIDCTAAPPATGFWEKDGASHVVTRAAGTYRESSGQGSVAEWGTDGFSYRFDLPESGALYRIRVEYPDDDRRSMGFWVTDNLGGQTNFTGVVNTGGVETGDHYRLTGKMLTHEAFFRPRNDRGLIVAVLNCVPGLKAAAARIRIDLVESDLPPAPAGERGGRAMGFYFEEPGRWLRFFGGEDRSPAEQIRTLERYGQWQRHIGSNLMFPTVQVYGGTHYPSRVLDGYMNTTLNETRLAALEAEKYGCEFVPELFLTGQMPFDSRTMGVRSGPKGEVDFLKPGAEDLVLRGRDGQYRCFTKPFAYNPLNPRVQQLMIDAVGELADMLADTKSFAGISSRIMVGWQNQCWNSFPCLDYGYGDWTIAEFTRDTGIAVPGAPGDPHRFRLRFEFLTGASMRAKWIDWRCARIFDFHRRLRDRIKQAKPSANLFLTYFPRDKHVEYSRDLLGQMREQGIDFARYQNEPGMQLVPGMTYGRRFSTPLSDAEGLDADYDPQIKAVARSGMRAAGVFGLYFEINRNLDWTKLGARKDLAAFDASVPGGRAELEGYATALADSDSSFLITGGNGWMFGTPELMQPFLREYRALPAKPFTRYGKAVDPVAIWQHRDDDGTLWFYAVNRLPVPVTAEITLGGKAPGVRPAAGGDELALDHGRLTLVLEPFMLKSFRAHTDGLTDFQARVPDDYVNGLRPGIEAATRMIDDLKARRITPEATRADTEEAIGELSSAIAAFGHGHYWEAAGQLQRAAVTRIEYGSGHYLPGVLDRSAPLGVPDFSDAKPKGFRVVLPNAPGRLQVVRDVAYDADGHLWTASDEGLSEFDGSGKWLRSVTLFLPYDFGNGDIRKAALPPPRVLLPDNIRALSNHRMLVQSGGRPPMVIDTRDGRVLPLALGDTYCTNTNSGRMLDAQSDGTALITIGNGPTQGTSLYAPDGTFLKRLSGTPAVAGALEAGGGVILSTPEGVEQVDANGRVLETLSKGGADRVVLAPGGATLLTIDRGAVSIWKRGADGRFSLSGTGRLTGTVNGVAFAPDGRLAVGYARDGAGALVGGLKISGAGLEVGGTLVEPAEPGAKPVMTDPTLLKTHRGVLYFSAGGKLMCLAGGEVRLAFDPKFKDSSHPAFEAFAFGPDGDLYLASHWQGSKRGINLYRCRKSGDGWAAPEYLNQGKPLFEGGRYVPSDIGVDSRGRILLPGDSVLPDKRLLGQGVGLFRWDPAGSAAPKMLMELGAPQVTAGEIGLHALPDGGWLIAGGNMRSIWRLDADCRIVWKTSRIKSCPPGYPELRCPLGITADSSGHVWVTDPTRHQILQLDLKTGRLLRSFGSFGDGSDTLRLQLNQPAGIEAVGTRNGREELFIMDAGNRRLVAMPVVF